MDIEMKENHEEVQHETPNEKELERKYGKDAVEMLLLWDKVEMKSKQRKKKNQQLQRENAYLRQINLK